MSRTEDFVISLVVMVITGVGIALGIPLIISLIGKQIEADAANRAAGLHDRVPPHAAEAFAIGVIMLFLVWVFVAALLSLLEPPRANDTKD